MLVTPWRAASRVDGPPRFVLNDATNSPKPTVAHILAYALLFVTVAPHNCRIGGHPVRYFAHTHTAVAVCAAVPRPQCATAARADNFARAKTRRLRHHRIRTPHTHTQCLQPDSVYLHVVAPSLCVDTRPPRPPLHEEQRFFCLVSADATASPSSFWHHHPPERRDCWSANPSA